MNLDLATVDHLLTTTRSVRRRLDFQRPVEPAIIERCLEIAIQAPTGSNRQGWRFVVVIEPSLRMGLAELYRKSFALYYRAVAANMAQPGQAAVLDSASYLAAHMHEVPVLILPCIEGRAENAGLPAQAGLYGSIIPAAWSLQLALRARGLGSVWTTLHLRYEQEAAQLLGIPSTVTQAALLPVAYFTGDDFKPAQRIPARDVTSWNGWEDSRKK